jgi:hypothetical protein
MRNTKYTWFKSSKEDLKHLAIQMLIEDPDITYRQVQKQTGVRQATLSSWVKKWRLRSRRGGAKSLPEAVVKDIRGYLTDGTDYNDRLIAQKIEKLHGRKVAPITIGRYRARLQDEALAEVRAKDAEVVQEALRKEQLSQPVKERPRGVLPDQHLRLG